MGLVKEKAILFLSKEMDVGTEKGRYSCKKKPLKLSVNFMHLEIIFYF